MSLLQQEIIWRKWLAESAGQAFVYQEDYKRDYLSGSKKEHTFITKAVKEILQDVYQDDYSARLQDDHHV